MAAPTHLEVDDVVPDIHKGHVAAVGDRGAGALPDDDHVPRGNVLVSFFWLHEVLSIASDYQSIEWRLGGPASSFVVTDGSMEAGQHTATEVATNRVLLFDNGLDRPGGALFSRGLEVALDPAAGTAQTAWQFRPTPDIYAPIISSTRRLDNGNTVVGFGLPAGRISSTGPLVVYEVTTGGRILWQMVVAEGTPEDIVYRYDP